MRAITRHALLPLALLLGLAAQSRAATYYWSTAACGQGGFSFTANCWTLTDGSSTLSGVPPSDSGHGLVIRNAGNSTLSVGYTPATGQRNYNFLVLDTRSTGNASIAFSGGSLSFDSRSSIGQNGGGTFSTSAGTVSFNDLTMGVSATATGGQLRLSGTAVVVARSLVIGQQGQASMQQSGESAFSSFVGVSLGEEASARGNLTVQGGTFFAPLLNVGEAGQGTVLQTGGSVRAGALSLATLAGGQGRYDLNGGRLTVDGHLLAPTGVGVLSLNGGELVVGGRLEVGALDIGSQGTFTLAAGKAFSTQQTSQWNGLLNLAGQATLANGASVGGTLSMSGGELLGSGAVTVNGLLNGHGRIADAVQWQSNGQVVVSGGALVLANGNRNVNSGQWRFESGGSLQLENGSSLRNNGQFDLGGASVQGNGLLVNERAGVMTGPGSVLVPFNNAGTMVLEAGRLRMAQGLAHAGELLLLGPTAQLTGAQIGNGGLIQGQGRIDNSISNQGGRVQARGGLLVLAGGVNNLGGVLAVDEGATLRLTGPAPGNAGRIELAGGTFDSAGLAVSNTGTISGAGVWRSGLVTQQGQLQFASGVTEWHAGLQALAGSRSIVSGLSRWVVDGAVEFQTGAELRVSEGSVATFFGDVQLRDGALVTGTGWKFYEAGLSLGPTPARLHDAGSVQLGDGAIYTAELGGLLPGSGHDQLQVAGRLQLGGTLRVVALPGMSFAAGQQFDLFDWGQGTGGFFSSIDTSAALLAEGLAWDSSRLYSDGVLSVSAVPEPAAGWLWMLGVGVLLAQRRRRAR